MQYSMIFHYFTVFISVLRSEDFTRADAKSAKIDKITVKLSVFFSVLGSLRKKLCVKAVRKTLVSG
jgi:hypothetical protein